MPDDVRAYLDAHSVAHYNPADHEIPGTEMPVTGANNGLTLKDFIGVSYDDPRWEQLLDQLTVDEMCQLVQIGGFSTVAVRSVGKVPTQDSDGTAGLNDWYTGVYGTPYPTMVQAMRQASKNILFTVVHSGNYTMEEERTGMDNMTRTFVLIDVLTAAVVLGAGALVFLNYRKKKAVAA